MAAKYNMTTGNITGHLTRFAVPLVLGNMLQLTYNVVDAIIVGRYVGEEAQAAVGVASPLMNVLIFFIVGCCNGISVLLSESYGAGDKERFKKILGNAVSFGSIIFLLVGAMLWIGAGGILRLISTPPEIIELTKLYLRIVILGLIFTFLYNVYASSARSIGNAKVPLLFLILSTLLNVAFDFILVVHLQLGVFGTAVGTVAAEAVSALLLIFYSAGKLPLVKLDWKTVTIDIRVLKEILNYSISTGLQKITLNVGKVIIQGFVNPLGISVVAAFNAANRIDDFVFQPQQSIASALTTFTAQNRGGGKKERIKQGFRYSFLMELAYWLVIAVVIFTQSGSLMQMFTAKEGSGMVQTGTLYLTYMSFIYILPAVTNWLQGYIRGFGRMNVCLMATFVQILGRVGAGIILIPAYGLKGVAFSCMIGWICMLGFEIPYYLWKKKVYEW